jgi:2-dehydro-3-deoxy-D-gluconate 5-dehydrogenase
MTATIGQLFDLQGKAAIVTGGAMGIGAAIAERLAEAGAAVLIADVNEEAARRTAARIGETGGRAVAFRTDMSQVGDIRAMVAAAIERFGRLDVLVNNAGIFPFTLALEMSEEQWDRVLDVNLKGAFFAAQAAARAMTAGGRIVNVASIDGLHPTGYLAHYDASKGGLVMLTRSLALEFGPRGIAVNAIAPGSIKTPGAAATTEALSGSAAIAMESFVKRIPLGRMGEPDDIAKVALFLTSGAADYITGGLIVVDGGYLLS